MDERGAGRLVFRINGRVEGEVKDVQGPVRFAVQFTTIGDGVRLLTERNLVLEVMEESASPLLSVLGAAGRRELAGRGSYQRWRRGKVVVREGEEAAEEEEEGVFLVLSGELWASCQRCCPSGEAREQGAERGRVAGRCGLMTRRVGGRKVGGGSAGQATERRIGGEGGGAEGGLHRARSEESRGGSVGDQG